MKNSIQWTKKYLFFCLTLIISETHSQCPVSSFSIASPVCSGSPLQITNSSNGGTSYTWDFAPSIFSNSAVKVADSVLGLSYPGDITIADENDTTLIFISGLGGGHMHRLTYGNGPGNPLTLAEDLGNFGALYQPSDIALFKQDSSWYGFIVDYGSNYLYRIHFGNSLKNTPDSITTILTNATSNFNSPWSIKITSDSTGTVYGVVGNHGDGSFVLLSFGNSVRNTPVASSPITVPGTSHVQDITLAKSCGNWYAFMAGNSSSVIVRGDFGNSLSNTPSFTTVITNGTPSDIVLINQNSHWILLYTDFNSWNIRKYDLGSDLANNSPLSLGTDQFGGSNPKGICAVRKNAETFVYILYSSNNVQTIRYNNTVQVNKAISNDATPNDIIFSSAGTYPVTLLITDNNGNYSSLTDSVVVTPAPQTNFFATSKCLGNTTSFADSSLMSSGYIASWNWSFDDGDTSSLQNPVHQYDTTGSYHVQLVTSSSFGCYDTLEKVVNITHRPQAAFSSPAAVCSNTSLQFNDQSTVAAGTVNSWKWNFGNGDSSIVQNPLYSFPNGGNFTVSLIVTTPEGCSNNTQSALYINDRPQAGFSASNTCIGQNVLFADKTIANNSSINNFVWDFGDGNTDTTANPTHLYVSSVANYPVTLIVTALNGCVDTTSQVIKINNIPTVSYSFLPSSVCQKNDVNFSDLSFVSGDTISKWLWDFGDSNSDTVANPVHRFNSAGQFTVSLIAYSPSNCPGTAYQQVINVKESPIASFNYSTTCIGNSTHFTNNSIPALGSTIDSAFWNFGSLDSSQIYNPDYTFNTVGSFPVTLMVISNDGCMGFDTIMVPIHDRPTASFTHSIACTGAEVLFTNTSICDSLSTINQYAWNFGDFSSGSNNSSTSQNPSHSYNSSVLYTVSLITSTNFGCKDTSINSITVNRSPSAQFTYSPTCYGDLMEFFNPGSSLDSSYLWNFGDNQTNQLQEPAHFYAFPGTYTVKLNVTARSGCTALASKQVTVSPIPTADFISTPACINAAYQFGDNSSIPSGSIVKWNWNIAGLPKPDSIQNPAYVFPDSGTYSVTLTVKSDIGCSKSVSKNITVHSIPVSNFSFDPQFGNPPLEIQTTDFSTGGNSYLWDFGDGSTIVNLHEPSHIYNDTGLFVITQYVNNQFGCKDTLSKNIYIINPVLDIAVTGDSSYFDGNYFHVVGRIENHGTRDVNNLQMEAKLENGNTISEYLTSTIPNGPTGYMTYPFHASFLVDQGTDFRYYCIKALNPNGQTDNVPGNDERCFNLTDEMITMNPFPNPFTSWLTIRLLLPEKTNLNIDLIDMTGKTIKNIFNGKTGKNLFEVITDLSELNDGIYSIRYIYTDKVIVRNVVKNSQRN